MTQGTADITCLLYTLILPYPRGLSDSTAARVNLYGAQDVDRLIIMDMGSRQIVFKHHD